MPNRILKDGICTSETIDLLSVEGERFFYRLLVQCDDFGRMDARPSVLRARCFPLRLDKVSDKLVSRWLDELVAANLVWLYAVEDKTYLQVTKWNAHQQIRAARSKYPEPPAPKQSLASASNGNQLISDDIKRQQVISLAPETPNPNPNPNPSRDSESESEEDAPPAAAQPPASPQVQIFLDQGGSLPRGKLADGTPRAERAAQYIAEHVADSPESLKLWAEVVFAYSAQWSPKSYTVMVNDYYLRGRVPGRPNGANPGAPEPKGFAGAREYFEQKAKRHGH